MSFEVRVSGFELAEGFGAFRAYLLDHELIKGIHEVAKMINGLSGHLRRSGTKGTGFKR